MSGTKSAGKYGPAAIATLPLAYQGKTRDTFLGCWPKGMDREHRPLIIVASNRISTHNVVHQSLIPWKGEVLTALTIFWLKQVLESKGVRHHLVAYGKEIYDYLPGRRRDYPVDLHHYAIVVEPLKIIPIEFIRRMYMCGSFWKDFYSKGHANPYGQRLPIGLKLMSRFDGEDGLFTPTDKSETDDPVEAAFVSGKYPDATELTREVFRLGRQHLNAVGLEGVDSKFEVGIDADGRVVLADEVWTGDSSRIANIDQIVEGKEPPWRDKQLARDEAERIWAGGKKVPLAFDAKVTGQLSTTYMVLLEQITELNLTQFQAICMS